jgi:anti-sigma28 factor (negative regulator of flagellin synthesis)
MILPVSNCPNDVISSAPEPIGAPGLHQVAAGSDGPETMGQTGQPNTDHTTLSTLGNLLGTITTKARATSSFRPDLVNRLKATVAAGTYQPDLAELATRVARASRAGAS